MADYSNLPDFDSLPPVKDMPQGCAWGIFDKDGKKDHLGCLNLLTPAVVQNAIKEATEGTSVSLNWNIGAIHTPGFGRKGLVHKVINFRDTPLSIHGFDDEVEFNTQCSSQWDSLIHFSHQPTGLAYNGASPTVDSLTQNFGTFDVNQEIPTLNHWHQRGGLVGRGVLLDYRAWAAEKGIQYNCFSAHRIKTSELEEIAKWEGVEFKHGDILIVRTGFTEDLGNMNADQQAEAMGTHQTVGVEGTAASAKWHWNKHFAAVAGDAIAYEALPPLHEDGSAAEIGDLVLHQYFLSLFGMNIGELWDLKALGDACKAKKKYSFLLTSCPLNVPGSIGSPPNALAIF